ncbi:hypothetical protein VP1G_08794 [Cytospora mali]|uniref:Uncharacterized protein n=1 Tax=Cytospora mali TaxID=578113 RepID=A0A194VCV6_CYTMA|nr:hypothetical protein VP1G_08794 [Valsa mali var. pyri (nom. inval.)]
MGFFDGWDSASVITRKPHSSRHHSSSHKRRSKSSGLRPKSRSRSRSRSPAARAFFAGDEDSNNNKPRYSRHNSSRTSFFGLPNVSSRSFFGSDKHRASTSSYRRSPRPNFLARAYKQLKRLLRDLVYYAKRHPVKVFTLVILPLITGGALTALLARFGLRMPPSIERMLGFGARAMSGDAAGLVGEAVKMAGAPVLYGAQSINAETNDP